MAHLDAYLGPCAGYGWTGGAEFQTRIVEQQGGRTRRNANWSQARHRYTAPFNNISKDAYREVKKMHLVCMGQLHSFRHRDVLDFEADSEVFAVGDGLKTVFQLSKYSTISGLTYQREIYALPSKPSFTANGSPSTPSVNLRTGEATFTEAPASGVILRWSGVFDIWVRFAQDFLPFSLDNPNATNGQVDLIEDDPPES